MRLIEKILSNAWLGFMRVFFRKWVSARVEGLEQVPANGGFILAANHSSHLDAAVLISIMDGLGLKLHCLGARDYFCTSGFKSWFFKILFLVVPCDRDKLQPSTIRQCRALLKSGHPILIFPEGTRSRNGLLQPFKPGLGYLAQLMKCPVIPVGITGSHSLLPKGQTLPEKGTIRIAFGTPIETQSSNNQAHKKEMRSDPSREQIVETVFSEVQKLTQYAPANWMTQKKNKSLATATKSQEWGMAAQ